MALLPTALHARSATNRPRAYKCAHRLEEDTEARAWTTSSCAPLIPSMPAGRPLTLGALWGSFCVAPAARSLGSRSLGGNRRDPRTATIRPWHAESARSSSMPSTLSPSKPRRPTTFSTRRSRTRRSSWERRVRSADRSTASTRSGEPRKAGSPEGADGGTGYPHLGHPDTDRVDQGRRWCHPRRCPLTWGLGPLPQQICPRLGPRTVLPTPLEPQVRRPLFRHILSPARRPTT